MDNYAQQYEAFADKHGIFIQCERKDSRTDGLWDDSHAMRNCRHFSVFVFKDGQELSLWHTQGSAHTQDPTIGDVLYSLQLDCMHVCDRVSFEEWCAEFGYDDDSRRNERTYNSCVSIYHNLSQMLGDEGFKEFMSLEEQV